MTRNTSESILTIDTSGLETGTHDLVIESFDGNSSVQSALKIDKINIEVTANTEEPTPVTELGAEPETEFVVEPESIKASFEYEPSPLTVQPE